MLTFFLILLEDTESTTLCITAKMQVKQGLVHFPLEDRDRGSPLKKLNTAVSIESPELFRIRGVPCIDRGSDGSRPPMPCQHWKQEEGADDARVYAAESMVKKTANFARPSSVSADTPNIFKVSKYK